MSDLLTRIEQNDQTITAREIFEHVVVNLLRQGKPSIRQVRKDDPEDYCCAYRGNAGTKCAAGWVIPDSLYRPEWEANTIRHIGHELPSVLQQYELLLDHLQRAHDSASCYKETFKGTLCAWLMRPAPSATRQILGDEWDEQRWAAYLQSLVDRAKEPAPA